MGDIKRREAKAAAEAAAWHTKLGAKSVSSEAVETFFAWRRDPVNDAAYRKVESLWSRAGDLKASPRMRQALSDAMGRKRPRRASRPILIGLGAVAAALALVIGATTWRNAQNQFTTGIGEEQLIQLADGSAVQLDTDSRLRVRFSGGERRVELEAGRALFTVAHDASRPFIVQSGDTEVRAVGTVFDVRRWGDAVTVSMVEGVVEVSGHPGLGKAPERISAGQQVLVGPETRRTRTIDPATVTSWSQNRLIFRETPLRDAVAEVNRYLTDKIVLAPDAPVNATLSGVFHTGDREAFVSAASLLLALKAHPQRDGSVRLSLQPGPDKNISGGSAENAT